MLSEESKYQQGLQLLNSAMNFIKPRSILQLTLAGFLSVTILLCIALTITARQISSLSLRSREIVSNTSAAMDLSRTLLEQSTSMERNARQYVILGDSDIFTLYRERHRAFVSTTAGLEGLHLDPSLDNHLHIIEELEDQAFRNFKSLTAADLDTLYGDLMMVAYRIADTVHQWSNTQIAEIADETNATQRMLTFQLAGLVGAALLLVVVFTALITRPLSQIIHAINHLGDGRYETEIAIDGPRDLVELGTRLDWLRNRLAKLEQQRSSFIRHVSHELKTPLSVIHESASLLNEGALGDLSGKQKEVIIIQLNNVRRLQALIDELLRHHLESFSIINPLPESVRLDSLVKSVIGNYSTQIDSQSLRIDQQLEPVSVNATKEQLRVVLDNLINNAVKYSPSKSTLSVSLHSDEVSALFEIADQGPGISPEDSEHIFEAYYQGTAKITNGFPGNGLGLAIAREYVKSNGGEIILMPIAGGAKFQLRLPLNGIHP